MFILKPLLMFSIGCALTAVLTWSSYEISRRSIRFSERKIITDISTQLQTALDITIGQTFMSTLIGLQKGDISPESFTILTNQILIDSPTTTSVGWVPIVEPEDREDFVKNSSLLYPDIDFSITFIGDFGEIFPRPVDNTTMWPLLHSNPILSEDFRGVDIHYDLWTNVIDLMVKENRTVISDLIDLTELDTNTEGILTNQRSIYQLFHPVFDAETYKLIGTFNRLFFPSRLVKESLVKSSILDIDIYQISLFRINNNNVKEDIYVQTSTGKLFTTGKNIYREEREINTNLFIIELITETSPGFETYGIILLVTFFSCLLVMRMYYIQMKTSKKDKEMSVKYERATNLKSTFLAEMSHELRTPLNGIIGTIDILSARSLDLNIKDYLQDIRLCGDMLLTIIAGILDFSKIEAGRVTLEIAPMNMNILMEDTARVLVQSFHTSKNVDVILNMLSIPTCEVFGDENRLRQIFMNLLSNALKFTTLGSITINVSCKEISSGKDTGYLDGKYEKILKVSISVQDTGIGISDDRIKDLFQPFSQLNSGQMSVGGTGLGLVITKTLCESMGGSVSCSSVYHKGSCFSCDVLLGIHTSFNVSSNCQKWNLIKNINQNTIIQEEKKDDIEYGSNRFQDVLIVDDVNVNRRVVGGLLELYGMEYDTAPDGVKAIELCKKTKYKLILMDYYMPGMTGIDVTVSIRDDKSNINRDSVIIGLTASHTQETIDSIMKSGMNGFELKPIRKDTIGDLCKKYVNVDTEGKIGQ